MMNDTARESSFVASFLALGTELVRTGSRLMAPLGISQQQSVMLVAIAEQGPMSQKDLRLRLLYDRSNVSKAVTQLVKANLLCTRPSAKDGRVVLVEATARGARLAARAMNVYREWNHRWLAELPAAELRNATNLLEKLRANLPGE